jgi:hypothetical protein
MSIRKGFFIMAMVAIATGCSEQVSYKNDVYPILKGNCFTCHDGKGEGSQASGFMLLSYDDLMKGTKYGQVVTPGDSLASTLYLMIDHQVDQSIQMPPHHGSAADGQLGPLSRDAIATIKTWIDQGAKNN